MNETPTKAQMGELDAVVVSQELARFGFALTPEGFSELPEDRQQRVEQWLSGSRPLPRFLLWYYSSKEPLELDEGSDWDDQSLAEEIADALKAIGISVTSPDVAFAQIQLFTPDEVDEAATWTWAVHVEAADAADRGREAKELQMPNCIVDLISEPIRDEPKEAVTNPVKSETREQAVARIQAGLHDVRAQYLERKSDFDEKSEAAKSAKKAMEAAQETLNDLIGGLDEALNSEAWQARLPLTYDAAPPAGEPAAATVPDPAKSCSVEGLVEFGVSLKQADKLLEADVETISELEARIRDVNGWFAKIKGIGQSAADKIADALMEWRKKYGYGG